MKLFFLKGAPCTLPPPPAEVDFARLIAENTPFIERQCRKAVASQCSFRYGNDSSDTLLLDNETDELLVEVIDRLRLDNFKILRDFKGTAKLTTYLTTIVANLAVDAIRHKKGRSRAKDRAREIGGTAEHLYDLVITRGWTVHEAKDHLETSFGIRDPVEKLQEILDRLRGRDRQFAAVVTEPDSTWLATGVVVEMDDGPEVVVADPTTNVEDTLIRRQKESLAREALEEALAGLSGEERLMLRLRFPGEDEGVPKSIGEISRMLGITEKAADARIRKILAGCRETILRRGLSLEDLIHF